MPTAAPAVTVHLTVADLDDEFRREAAWDLRQAPKCLSPRWFYDERGSALFEEITRLPEYYPTRAERSILEVRAPAILARSGAESFVELGSGASEKTTLLLDAGSDAGTLRRFVPFDVCEPFLRASTLRLAARYPGLEVHGIVGDLQRHLADLPVQGRTLLALLGGTFGNLLPTERAAFLQLAASALSPGDTLLLGTDLVKNPARLVAAYDDADGLTAEFNRNVLLVLNQRLLARFHPEDFAHLARWDAEHERIEMHLVARRSHNVVVGALEAEIPFVTGERWRTEISAKFRREGLESELAAGGFELAEWWTDPQGDYALSLSIRC